MRKTRSRTGRAIASLLLALLASRDTPAQEAPRPNPVENVFLVTLDGFRWQEVFGGFDAANNNKADGGVEDPKPLAQRFDWPTPEARREALLPFLWSVVAREGQILGDPAKGSLVRVTNRLWFSYPGYNELLSGAPDPPIDSNDKKTNPNLTVLEWLNGLPGFAGRVAAFGSWDVLPFIVAADRSRLHVNGDGPAVKEPATDRDRLLNDFTADLPSYWEGARFDAPTMQGALEHLRTRKPRVLYVMLGETDEWAHERRYDQYLDAAWRGDRFLRRLWEAAQSDPDYRGKTALLVATDHGRGATPRDWPDHGKDVPAAERIWMAVLGPTTPALGIRQGITATQSQMAASVAALLGLDFRAASGKAAPPLPDLSR
jgi:Type I phosphodiesterase / nucleotide pyrophosphatase